MKFRILPLVLLGAGGGGGDDWGQAMRRLQEALAGRDEARLEQAVGRVAADDSARAVEALVRAARSAPPGAYWTILAGMARLGSPAALDALGREILEGKVPELRRDLILPLRYSEAPGAVELLKRILREGSPDLQVSAMDELVDRERLDAAPILLDLADKDPGEERELTRRAFKALRALAKEDPPAGGPAAWRRWWAGIEARAAGRPAPPPSPRRVGETVADSIRRTRVTDYEALKRGKKEEVLVIEGVADNVEDVLFRLGIPYQSMSWERIQSGDDLGFKRYLAVFVNCGTGDWPPRQVERIKEYVSSGGYLFVTDQAILQVVKHAFPNYIIFGKGTFSDLTVDIYPCKGTLGSPLLRGIDILPTGNRSVTGRQNTLQWKICSEAPVLVFDPSKAIPLIEAPSIVGKKRSPVVAITFSPGISTDLLKESIACSGIYEEFGMMDGGKVICVISHFKLQRQGEDGFALQNLLINFLIEAKDRALLREKRKK
ncbi:MAG TPA: HEAT repeat domain-containing protein [Planctomycetota bacterium]|nr:HEAT repeat domain-containing protein [Planctomycetota bacterium]